MAASPAAHVNAALAKFSPKIRAVARAALAAMRRRMPGATEFVYDNYNALVVGFGPTGRPSEAVLSVVIYPGHVNLGFLQGAVLDDPHQLLQGSGTQFRHIKLIPDASVLERPGVQDLIARAIADADAPFDPARTRTIDIRSVSKKQRPRRLSN
jgi:hypothetical protein